MGRHSHPDTAPPPEPAVSSSDPARYRQLVVAAACRLLAAGGPHGPRAAVAYLYAVAPRVHIPPERLDGLP